MYIHSFVYTGVTVARVTRFLVNTRNTSSMYNKSAANPSRVLSENVRTNKATKRPREHERERITHVIHGCHSAPDPPPPSPQHSALPPPRPQGRRKECPACCSTFQILRHYNHSSGFGAPCFAHFVQHNQCTHLSQPLRNSSPAPPLPQVEHPFSDSRRACVPLYGCRESNATYSKLT